MTDGFLFEMGDQSRRPQRKAQGASRSTARKQTDLGALVGMWLLMHKNQPGDLWVFDTHCGSGWNMVAGSESDGSPVVIARQIREAEQRGIEARMWISDVDEVAVREARELALSFTDRVSGVAMHALESVGEIHRKLSSDREARAFVYIDPNGPSELPWQALGRLIENRSLSHRLTVAMNWDDQGWRRVLKDQVVPLMRAELRHAGAQNPIEWFFRDIPPRRRWVRDFVGDPRRGNSKWTILVRWPWALKGDSPGHGFVFATPDLLKHLSITPIGPCPTIED